MNKDGVSAKLTSKPFLTFNDVEDLLHRLFGIEGAEVKELESYDDRTYYVKTEQTHKVYRNAQFIFKVMNSRFSAIKGVVEAQTSILQQLESFPELCCQITLPNLNGDLMSYEMIPNDLRDGEDFVGRASELSVVRLFNFIPGQVMHDVSPLPTRFFHFAGKHLGSLQQALQECHVDEEVLKRKTEGHLWTLTFVPKLREFLPCVTDIDKRQLLEEIIGEFEKNVLPVIGQLKQGIIYADFNDGNTLVTTHSLDDVTTQTKTDVSSDQLSEDNGRIQTYKISGLIDFDDMGYSCLVYEIAIGMMYVMLVSDEPLEASGSFLAGFEKMAPLTCEERGLLKILVAGRFAQSLLIGLQHMKKYPTNEYVGNSQDNGWTLLELWWNQTEDGLQKLWDKCRKDATEV